MRLIHLRIQGYRSLYDVNFFPQQLSVLVGPNNAGKTNFVEAVDFLAETYRHGIEVAINRKGGIENIAHRRMRRTRRPLMFEVEIQAPVDELPRVYFEGDDSNLVDSDLFDSVQLNHRFSLQSIGQAIEADYQVIGEEVRAWGVMRGSSVGHSPLFSLVRKGAAVDVTVGRGNWRRTQLRSLVRPFDLKDFREYMRQSVPPGSLLVELYPFNPIMQLLSSTLASTRLYQLVPLEGRRPGVPTPNAEVERHGSNLPAMVAFLQRHDQRGWTTIMQFMRRIIPDLLDIRTEFTPDRRLALQFLEAGVRRAWSAEDVSDGSIQSLALVTTLMDRRVPIVLIEEPENSIHPWIIRNFVETCREVHKQVVITTHSPVLVSYLKPEELFLTWRREGRTTIATLEDRDHQARSLWESGELSLFDIIDGGSIREIAPG